MCESMDALFIGRKKAAGWSARPPLFGETKFYNQEAVDSFVQSCGEQNKLNSSVVSNAQVRISF